MGIHCPKDGCNARYWVHDKMKLSSRVLRLRSVQALSIDLKHIVKRDLLCKSEPVPTQLGNDKTTFFHTPLDTPR